MKTMSILIGENKSEILKSNANNLSPEIFTVDTTLQLVKDVASLEKFGVKPVPSPSLAWFSFVLNHTLPDINSRGRCWSYKTQKNSIASCKHNLIDLEHIMEDNGLGHTKNAVIGNMVDVFLPEIADIPSVPDKAVSSVILGVLYKRLPIVQRILSQIEGGKQYQISMECIRDASSDAIYHKGKFIPIEEAEQELRKSVGETIDGDRVGLALGGEDGLVYYWGTALTLHPADKKADILSFCASKEGCCIEISTAENAGRGDGQGKGGSKQGDGGASNCVCPSCGAKAKHEKGIPCTSIKCSKCGAKMIGADEKGGEKGVKKIKKNKEGEEDNVDLAEVKEVLESVQEKLKGIDVALEVEPIESPQDIGSVSLEVLDSLSRQINCPKCGGTYSSTIKSIDLVKNKMFLTCSSCNTNYTLRYAVTSKGAKKSIGGDKKMDKLEISQEELDKKIKEAVDKASVDLKKENVDLKKEKELAEQKLQEKASAEKLDERVKKMEEEKLEISEERKEKIKKMAISEEGDKEFSSYLEDLKKAKAEGKEIASDENKDKNKNKRLPVGGGEKGNFVGAH